MFTVFLMSVSLTARLYHGCPAKVPADEAKGTVSWCLFLLRTAEKEKAVKDLAKSLSQMET